MQRAARALHPAGFAATFLAGLILLALVAFFANVFAAATPPSGRQGLMVVDRDLATIEAADAEPPAFQGRPLRRLREVEMLVTAYSPDFRSCGKWADGFTASGRSVWTNGMRLVAADTTVLPLGAIISVPGYHNGKPVPVLDRGGKIKGNRLDVLYPTHEMALQWGARRLTVAIWEYAD